MTVRIANLCVDAADPAKIAAFWQQVLGWDLEDEDPDEVAVVAPEGSKGRGVLPDMLFLRVPEPKTVKNRLHMCLRSTDQAAEVARVEALGARRVDIGQGDDVSWVVLADPEGNEFCVLKGPLPPDDQV